MKKILSYIALSILLGFSITACSDWLDVKPIDQTLQLKQYATEEGILSVQNGLYQEMSTKDLYGGNMTLTTIESLGNRNAHPNNAGTNAAITTEYFSNFDYTRAQTKNVIATIWSNSYRLIFRINNYLKGIDESSATIDTDKKMLLMGEGYALRAYLHFDLFRLFGPLYINSNLGKESIPYNDMVPTGEYYEQSILMKRATAQEFMDKVLDDIKKAEDLLVDTDPIIDNPSAITYELNGEDPYSNRNRRLNYYGVRALKARVLQYMGKHSEAATIAKELLELTGKKDSNSRFIWQESKTSAMADNTGLDDFVLSSEVIFGIPNSDFKKNADSYFRLEDATKGYFENDIFHDKIFNLDGDIRKEFGYKDGSVKAGASGFGNNVKSFYYGYRFAISPNTKYVQYYFQPLIRMSEMYYIVAESMVRSQDLTGAIDYLNDFIVGIRKVNDDKKLGRPDSPDLNDKTEPTEDLLLKFITKEYYREFCYEGQVFFRNKRLQSQSENPTGAALQIIYSFTGEFTNLNPEKIEKIYVLPIPDAETDI